MHSHAPSRATRRLLGAALVGVTSLAGALISDLTDLTVHRTVTPVVLAGDASPIVVVLPLPGPVAAPPVVRPTVAPVPVRKPVPKATPATAPARPDKGKAARAARRAPAAQPAAQPAARAAARPAPFTAAEAERRGRAAYNSLHHALPTGWRLDVRVYAGTNQGLADSAARRVTLWVRSSDTPAELRITLAHELGHVLDYTTLSDRDRQRYLELRDRVGSTAPWYPRNGTSDYASPAGDFAEVYALWRGGAGDFRSTFAPAPDRAHLDQAVSLFRELEARQA